MIEKITMQIPGGTGLIERHPRFPSDLIQPRAVDVWLPPSYLSESGSRHPVIYMHDGQNLFDPAQSYAGVDWGMDEAVAKLSRANEITEPIIVGIWNTDQRWREYMPQKPLDLPGSEAIVAQFLERAGGMPVSDSYLAFLANELKPYIDSHYRTLPEQPDTSVMGSSMGGLISLYAALEYPQVFGGAACLSTHWPAGEDCLIEYLRVSLPAVAKQRFYFDYGTEGLDAAYEEWQIAANRVFGAAKYMRGVDWVSLKFAGEEHSERSWRKRVHLALRFLLAGYVY